MTDRIYTTTTEIERARALWEKGVLLAERIEGYRSMRLYQLHGIYLEVVWHMHFNVVLKVITFSDTAHLEPYLNNISLEGLWN